MKLKQQCSVYKIERVKADPRTYECTAYYQAHWCKWEVKQASEAYLLGDDLYCKVLCKQPKSVTGGYIQEHQTWVRYNVDENYPRKDGVAFFKLNKVRIF